MMSERGRDLVDRYINGTLAKAVDIANKQYGHGVARTNDFGFPKGTNMCTVQPTDLSIALSLFDPQ